MYSLLIFISPPPHPPPTLQTMLSDLSSKASSSPCERTWSRYLSVVDTWSVIPKATLDIGASHVGWRALMNNLGNVKCINCDKEAICFSVLPASRCCLDCWRSIDTGEKGVTGTNKVAQCTVRHISAVSSATLRSTDFLNIHLSQLVFFKGQLGEDGVPPHSSASQRPTDDRSCRPHEKSWLNAGQGAPNARRDSA